MKETFYITREIEIETNIEIKKEDTLYFAYINANGYNERKIDCFIDENNEIDIDSCDTDEEWDCIYNLFKNYIIQNGIKYARKCNCCDKGMNEGYFADYEYFCSDSCLHTEYPPYTWSKFVEEDEDNYYWTEWETEEDFDYVLFDNKLITI